MNWKPWRIDEESGRLIKAAEFSLPLEQGADGYLFEAGDERVWVCSGSDYLERADQKECEAVFAMIRKREALSFALPVNDPVRFLQSLPEDWGEGYPNASLLCRCRTEKEAQAVLPALERIPAVARFVSLIPLSERFSLLPFLKEGKIAGVFCAGGDTLCDFNWVLSMRADCVQSGVPFFFLSTGALFRKGGRVYRIDRKNQIRQAKKAGIDFTPSALTGSRWLKEDLFLRLACSEFRSRFSLGKADREYVQQKGRGVLYQHAADFIRQRLAPAVPKNDGKQTPMRGHPVFIAQHATGCCCRSCLSKWHHIPPGRELTAAEQAYIATVLLEWIRRQMQKQGENLLNSPLCE